MSVHGVRNDMVASIHFLQLDPQEPIQLVQILHWIHKQSTAKYKSCFNLQEKHGEYHL